MTQDHAVSVCNFYFDEIVFTQLLTSNFFIFSFAHCLFSQIKLKWGGGGNETRMYDTLILTSALAKNSSQTRKMICCRRQMHE